MSGEIVGYALAPRPGRPSRYCGRTMRFPIKGQRFTDEGLGNPFTQRNSDDPVADFYALLMGSSEAIQRLKWTQQRWVDWKAGLPRLLIDRDLLCWCRKPGTLTANTLKAICHADILLAWIQAWVRRHPEVAAALRRELAAA